MFASTTCARPPPSSPVHPRLLLNSGARSSGAGTSRTLRAARDERVRRRTACAAHAYPSAGCAPEPQHGEQARQVRAPQAASNPRARAANAVLAAAAPPDAARLRFPRRTSVRASASAAAADALPRGSARQDANGKWTGLQVSYQVRAPRAPFAAASAREADRRDGGGGAQPCHGPRRVCRARTASRRRCWRTTAARPRRSTSLRTRSRCAHRTPPARRLPRSHAPCALLVARLSSSSSWIAPCCPSRTPSGCAPAGRAHSFSCPLRLTRRWLAREASTATTICCCATGCTSWARRVRLLCAHTGCSAPASRRTRRLTRAAHVAQVNLKVNHCLLALPGVKREDVKRVMSHPQARTRASRQRPAAGPCVCSSGR